jgi:SAM-dependent methyltransferase
MIFDKKWANGERVERSKIFFIIFLSSFSSLAYEITLTRVFSISLSYHFAFMIISIAMLGIGASGTVLSVFPGLKNPSLLGIDTLLLGISIPLTYLLSKTISFDPIELLWAKTEILYLGLTALVLSIPFFFSGLIIAKALTLLSQKSALLYGGDLLGAGAGSIGILFLMMAAGPDQAVFFISSIALLSPLILGGKGLKAISLILNLLVLSMAILHPSWMAPWMSPYKELRVALRYPEAKHLKTYDSPFSRIDLFRSPAVRFAPGLSLKYLDPLPEQIGFSIDGGEINAVTNPADRASLRFLKYLPSALPYGIRRPEDVLVLDPRGGLQVLVADYFGSKNVYQVEGNPLLIKIIRNDLRDFSGRLYSRRTWPGLGRSFLRSFEGKFDLIDLSLMGAVPSGSFGIAEDYRYTVEAFREYLEHLKPGGFLSISLYLLPPPRMEWRLLNTLRTAMEELGMEDAERRIASIRTWGSIILLGKGSAISSSEIEAIKKFSEDRRFDLVYYPGIQAKETNRYIKMVSDDYAVAFKKLLDPKTSKTFIDHYAFDIRPVRDENPFFHDYLRLKHVKEIYRIMGRKWQYFIQEGYLLPVLFVQVFLLSLLIVFLPAVTMYRKDKVKAKVEVQKRENSLNLNLDLSLLYFAFLGLGFMFVEVSLVQKLILPLEMPSYAVAAVLASLLISSGAGSLLSHRVTIIRTPSISIVLSVLVAAYGLFLPPLIGIISPYGMAFKLFLAFFILFPLGLFMGIPFPAGLRILGETQEDLIPWAWAINGCLSVLAPLLAVMLAMASGFRSVLWAGAGAYLLAFLTSFFLSRRSSEQRPLPPTVPS